VGYRKADAFAVRVSALSVRIKTPLIFGFSSYIVDFKQQSGRSPFIN
jgi:hypothetical protein